MERCPPREGSAKSRVASRRLVPYVLEGVSPASEVVGLLIERVAPTLWIAVFDRGRHGEDLAGAHANDLADAENPAEGEIHIGVLELRAC